VQSETPKADTDVRREMQRAALKQDISTARPIKELAWEAIKNGCSPEFVAYRYGFKVEEMRRAKEVHEAREAERLARYECGNVACD
jgi:hypothetical protein